jgi:hypothetical protein
MARHVGCKKMGNLMNWAMYIEWTNSEQQHYKQCHFRIKLKCSFHEKIEKGVQMEEIHDQVVAHTNIMLGKFFPYIFLVQRLMVIWKNEFVAFSKLE